MKGRSLFSFFFLMLVAPVAYAQTCTVVEDFYRSLGNRDFSGAYELCTGKQWGTEAQFSSVKMYGGIYAAQCSKIAYTKTGDPDMLEAEADVYVRDSVNGDGRFVQHFIVVKKNNKWLVQHARLLLTDRADNGWNLKLVTQPGLTREFVSRIVQPVYDKLGNEPTYGEPADTLKREINDARFFQTPQGLYAVVVVQIEAPNYAANTGWCDVFVFEQKKDKGWQLTDSMLNAGGGGMYGNPGAFGSLMRAGNNVVGLALTGGQMHMGDLLSFDDILAIENGKLYPLVTIITHHGNSDFGDVTEDGDRNWKKCRDNTYRFIKSEKKNYDLQVTNTDCLHPDREKVMGKAILPFNNDKKQRYKIPDSFVFER